MKYLINKHRKSEKNINLSDWFCIIFIFLSFIEIFVAIFNISKIIKDKEFVKWEK